MPYTAYPTTQAEALDRTFVAIKARVTANKNPLKAGGLKKELEAAGNQLKTKLDADIKGVRDNAIQHWQKVDQWLGQCVAALKRSEDAYQTWQATHLPKDAALAGEAAEVIRHIHEQAQNDNNDFGQSWFGYRGYNPNCDEKYKASYKNEVGKIMAESKSYIVKIAKMENLHQEAVAVKNLAIARSQMGDRVIVEKQGRAEEMLNSLRTLAGNMFLDSRDPEVAMGNMERIKTNAANPKITKTVPLKTFEQLFANLTNLIKTYNQGVISMDKVYQSGIAQFQGDEEADDPEIKRNLGLAQKLRIETKSKVQTLESGYKTAVKDMEKLRGHYKKK